MKTPTQSKSSFTPGPWRANESHDYIEPTGGSPIICEFDKIDPVFALGDDERIANAHLIAAAPELLAALEQFVQACDTAPPVHFIGHIVKACEVARAAIVKAKGEA